MEITNRTTVKQLIGMGVTLAQIENLVKRVNKKEARNALTEERSQFMEEVFTIMVQNPECKWKNGKILKTWFPNGKSQDPEIEKARKQKHSEISRALSELSNQGRIVKIQNGNSASSTFYQVRPALVQNDENVTPEDEVQSSPE
jgi:DNA-binding transcriptional MerR regulator